MSKKHLYSLHTYICTGAQDTCLVHVTFNAKNAHALGQARPCDRAATSLPYKPLRHILHYEFRQNPRQPMMQLQLPGCVVAQASSDHPRWCGTHLTSQWLTPNVRHGRDSVQD